jgi:hypothetical protein
MSISPVVARRESGPLGHSSLLLSGAALVCLAGACLGAGDAAPAGAVQTANASVPAAVSESGVRLVAEVTPLPATSPGEVLLAGVDGSGGSDGFGGADGGSGSSDSSCADGACRTPTSSSRGSGSSGGSSASSGAAASKSGSDDSDSEAPGWFKRFEKRFWGSQGGSDSSGKGSSAWKSRHDDDKAAGAGDIRRDAVDLGKSSADSFEDDLAKPKHSKAGVGGGGGTSSGGGQLASSGSSGSGSGDGSLVGQILQIVGQALRKVLPG